MKIAYIGKGGSGKSSVSWLATRMLAARGRTVFAIDADHNMDLAALLGVSIGADTPTFHRAHNRFRDAVGVSDEDTWGSVVLDGRALPNFSIVPPDSFTQSLMLPVPNTEVITLAAVGLGADDVLFSGKCAHGHSAPLKFYLPLLSTDESSAVVVDGVAGVDMMNFGLFLGCDAVVVVVEPHPNSMRVLAQVAQIADRTNVPLYVVVNKVQEAPSPYWDEIEKMWGERIVGRIPADLALASYDYDALKPETILATAAMITALIERTRTGVDTLARMRAFEVERAKV